MNRPFQTICFFLAVLVFLRQFQIDLIEKKMDGVMSARLPKKTPRTERAH